MSANVTVLTDGYGLQRGHTEVKRKAAVGERIKIVKAYVPLDYANGDVFVVTGADTDGIALITDNAGDTGRVILPEEYVVLEPTALSSQPPDIQTREILANLAQRISALEAEVAALKKPEPSVIADGLAKLGGVAPKITVPTRDQIVERAKADVEDLLRIGRDDFRKLPMGPYSGAWYDADFVVNREKRTVAALVFGLSGFSSAPYPRKPNGPHARGIAKAAPGDCFNVHIGKAIALRRALGLEVPEEYVNAPQPEGVRVGDSVRIVDASATNIGYVEGLAETKDAYIREIDPEYRCPYRVATRDGKAGAWCAREAFEVLA